MADQDADTWEPYRPPIPAPGASDAAPALADLAEETLWRCWLDRRDRAVQTELVARYQGYARALAARLFARRYHRDVEFDEYLQFAMVGLMEAIDRYRPDRGAILSGLQHLSEQQEQIAWRRRALRERAASLSPDDAFSTDGSPRLLHELLAVAAGLALGVMLDGTGLIVGPEEGLPDNAYGQVELRELRGRLWPLLEQLTPRERAVIQMHYVEARAFEEVARLLDLSKGRISQLHRQALTRLRELIDKSQQRDALFL